jgi:hypothetical protein
MSQTWAPRAVILIVATAGILLWVVFLVNICRAAIAVLYEGSSLEARLKERYLFDNEIVSKLFELLLGRREQNIEDKTSR